MKTKLLLLMAFICQISFAQVSNADLLAYYPFDTDANNHAPGATQFNLSVFGNGSLYTAPLLQTTDKIKGAGSYQFFFNGRTLATDDFSSLPNKSLSVSYWMRLPNGPSSANPLRTGVEFYGSLFMRGYFNFGVSTTDGKFDVYNYDSTTSSTGPWSHCVLVFDAETNYIKAYLNGQLVASKAVFINNIHQYAPKMMIGGGFNGTLDDIEPSKSLPGNIDEMYVYNRVLTDSEITALYNLEDPISTATTPTIGCWRDVKVGYDHMVGLKYDGTIWAWGLNNNGQLGNGTTTNSSTPVQVGTDNDWDVISAGGKASYAIKKNGTLWAWGDNQFGQLGIGNTTSQLTPIQVGIDNGWTDVSAGFEHVIAIKNGGLFGWGRNHVGQIGQSNLTNSTTPIQYASSNSWKKIATGLYHSFAINANQRLYASGFNANGQLGIGSINNASLFVQVTNATTWREIACGSYHSLAMRNEFVGLGWGWGLNNWTQIGNNGSNANAPTNYTYPNNVTFIDKMAAGESHSLFIADGQLLVRGRNTEGQLGIANNTQQTSWVVAGNNWSVIAAGQNMSAGINRNGELFTWGQNTFGQLGIGSTTNANSPQAVGCPTTTLSCPTGDVIITTQAEVDALASCTTISGNVTIDAGNTALDLTPLDNITAIGGFLTILRLTNNQLDIFPNLTTVANSIQIRNNTFTEFSGFNSLTTANNGLQILQNSNLTSLSGFNALINLNGNNLGILLNNNLATINAFSNLQSVPGLLIRNTQLNNLSFLSSLIENTGQLSIENNPLLTSANFTNPVMHCFCTGIVGGDYVRIQNNPELTNVGNVVLQSSVLGNPTIEFFQINDNTLLNSVTMSLDASTTSSSIVGNLAIANNSALSNLNFLNTINVTSCGGILFINALPITSLASLSSLTSVGEIQLSANANLTDISALNNINIGNITSVLLNSNAQLATCAVDWVCDYLATTAPNATISGNAPGCESSVVVEAACAALSSSDFELESNLKIYPNPFNSHITFDFGNYYENVTVLIHDITGKQLYKNSFSGNQFVVNNLGNLPSGIYVATLTTENGTSITKKIVK